jgi:hypothetical protein
VPSRSSARPWLADDDVRGPTVTVAPPGSRARRVASRAAPAPHGPQPARFARWLHGRPGRRPCLDGSAGDERPPEATVSRGCVRQPRPPVAMRPRRCARRPHRRGRRRGARRNDPHTVVTPARSARCHVRGGASRGVGRPGSRRQLGPAATATVADDAPAGLGVHARTEPVLAATATVVGLIRALHDGAPGVFEVARGMGRTLAGTPPEEGATGQGRATAVSRCSVVAEGYRCARCAGNRSLVLHAIATGTPVLDVPVARPDPRGVRSAAGDRGRSSSTTKVEDHPGRTPSVLPHRGRPVPPRWRPLSTVVDDVVDEVSFRVWELVGPPQGVRAPSGADTAMDAR